MFRDDFDTLNRGLWDDHIWYDCCPSVSWTGFQTAESGGLHLRTSRSFIGSGGSPYPIQHSHDPELGQDVPVRLLRGTHEVVRRARRLAGILADSYRHATNPAWPSVNPICSQLGEPVSHCYAGELDVFEGQGSEPQAFYGTIHRNSCGCYSIGDQQNGNNWQPAGVDLTAGFHSYGMLWTATQVSWYLAPPLSPRRYRFLSL